ncbi:MAG: hypothetical protein ACTSVG_02540 [Alphaproteobacteria bacterium]
MNRCLKYALVAGCAALAGCMSAQQHQKAVGGTAASDNLTVGKVQREIRVGMSSAEVVEVLGSPNLVTTDEQRREVWVYDKISTESVRSSSGAYGTLILFGGSTRSGASSTTQMTLTVVIKYGDDGLVRDFAYRQSKF